MIDNIPPEIGWPVAGILTIIAVVLWLPELKAWFNTERDHDNR